MILWMIILANVCGFFVLWLTGSLAAGLIGAAGVFAGFWVGMESGRKESETAAPAVGTQEIETRMAPLGALSAGLGQR